MRRVANDENLQVRAEGLDEVEQALVAVAVRFEDHLVRERKKKKTRPLKIAVVYGSGGLWWWG
jgi:hypothetical protein